MGGTGVPGEGPTEGVGGLEPEGETGVGPKSQRGGRGRPGARERPRETETRRPAAEGRGDPGGTGGREAAGERTAGGSPEGGVDAATVTRTGVKTVPGVRGRHEQAEKDVGAGQKQQGTRAPARPPHCPEEWERKRD